MGPEPASTVLTVEQEAIAVAFQRHTLLTLNKTLRGLTRHEFVCAQGQKNPTIFTRDPTHLTLGLYT